MAADDKFIVFERWLLDNGSKFPKLELKDYGDEVRGCHATADLDTDEVAIEIPLRCMITVEMGKETDVGRAIIASNIDLDAPKHIFLMIFMLLDRKNPHSFFKPYYDILPQTLNNMPIFWNEDELRILQGSYLLQQIDERNLAIQNDYNAILSVVPTFDSVCTLHEFAWARMCVCSRNFGLIVNGVRTAALVPYADMLNHYRPRETKWQFEDSRQGFTIITLNKIGIGAQVYDSYGQKCNHRFLLNYGFSIENNTEEDGFCPNEVPLLFHLLREDPLYDLKCSLWQRDSFIPSRRLRIGVMDNENYRFSLAMLRIIVANESDLNKISQLYGNSSYRSVRDLQVPIDLPNEIRAVQHLKSMCLDYLSRYLTTLQQDQERLQSNELRPFSNERHAVIQLKGEKEILHFYLDFVESALALYNCTSMKEVMRILEEYKRDKNPLILRYCQSVVYRLKKQEEQEIELLQKQIDFTKPTVV